MTQVKKTYFCADGAIGAAVAAPVALVDLPPSKKAFTQVVLLSNAKCTEKEPTATAPKNKGMPTVGLTTVHIFP
jgi:hypothetical protein